MPNFLNQSKHNESDPRLALQISNQEQKRSRRGAEEEQNEVLRILVQNFALVRIFALVRNLMSCEMFSLPFC